MEVLEHKAAQVDCVKCFRSKRLAGVCQFPECPERARQTYLPNPLTLRQQEILELIFLGMTNREITHHLGTSHYTVKAHVQNILTALNAKNRVQACRFALENAYLNVNIRGVPVHFATVLPRR